MNENYVINTCQLTKNAQLIFLKKIRFLISKMCEYFVKAVRYSLSAYVSVLW